MDVEIEKKNGEKILLSEAGAMVKDFIVSSISLDPSYESHQGRHGRLDMGAYYEDRDITVPIFFHAYDLLHFPLMRDKLFSILNSNEAFYIRELRRPKKMQYAFIDVNERSRQKEGTDNVFVGGKRYLVRPASSFVFEQEELHGFTEVEFETTELPFAESIGTSLELESDGSLQPEIWGHGMGLSFEHDSQKYTHEVSDGQTFHIYNASNVAFPVPFHIDFKIIIESVSGGVDGIRVVNETNNSRITFNGELSSSDTLTYDRAQVMLNNLNALGDADKEFLTLATGWNTLRMERASSAQIAVDTRFYYK
ncbi:phage tail domain-containing protein [Natribacillus halophilus]|uniref:Phage tail protein n=1 Tax=Natribacillus halophilus TaxID=549003 RepID=A0A1G8RTE1_9BACI|nr:phage tail domain-containing protein [Natribacillus halophilus]SDJ19745.1 Phage tail protein [Natribacillus halophilus]